MAETAATKAGAPRFSAYWARSRSDRSLSIASASLQTFSYNGAACFEKGIKDCIR